jgi:hypothetical protein
MDAATLRAWWAHRQGLDGSLVGAAPAAVLERSGWSRSVGGVGPYLTLFARAGTSRAEAEQAAAALRIHELPSARGCTYVTPAADFALALKVGEGYGDMRTALKLGVTEKEVDTLCAAIEKALVGDALEPDELRAAIGSAWRSLGPEGVKKGLSTTLPLGLGRLQTQGRIRRVPVNGRLDQQRYKYVRWDPSPLAQPGAEGQGRRRSTGHPWATLEEAFTELARKYFRWIGPATLAEFQWFSGLGVKAAKDAVAPLALAALDADSGRLMHKDDLEALRAFKRPKDPQYALVSSLDALALHRRDVQGLIDDKDRPRTVVQDKARVAVGALTDLPSHGIFDRGRLVGLWEYDHDGSAIAWASFGIKDKALKDAVARTEAFVRDDLGDARSFSLDSPKSRVARIEALRKGF